MLNVFGRPKTGSFAAFGYCAGPHRDKDKGFSLGWTRNRPENVSFLLFVIDLEILKIFSTYSSLETNTISFGMSTSSCWSFRPIFGGLGWQKETLMAQQQES